MNGEDSKLTEAGHRFKALLQRAQSLMLGTLGDRSVPLVSYAPFVMDAAGSFYVYVSRLSGHTPALIANPAVSVLVIEDESEAKEIFARTRISYACDAAVIDPTDARYDQTLGQFAARFGDVVQVLRSLPDFVLFRLTPRSGRFVTGFGQAYELTGGGLDQLVHLGPDRIRRGGSSPSRD